MSDIDTKLRRETEAKGSPGTQSAELPPVLLPAARRRRFHIFPLLITYRFGMPIDLGCL